MCRDCPEQMPSEWGSRTPGSWPRPSAADALALLMAPSSATCTTASTSGSAFCTAATTKTEPRCQLHRFSCRLMARGQCGCCLVVIKAAVSRHARTTLRHRDESKSRAKTWRGTEEDVGTTLKVTLDFLKLHSRGRACDSSTGPSRAERWCAGASDTSQMAQDMRFEWNDVKAIVRFLSRNGELPASRPRGRAARRGGAQARRPA